MKKLLDIITSLKLTIACLLVGIVLVFAGTLAQVSQGLHHVQEAYFQSWLVWWSPAGGGWKIPVFPGGHLLGAVMLVNLVAIQIFRLRWAWNRLGSHLTHFGLIVMLVGGLLTDLLSVESYMRLAEGESRNYSEDDSRLELAIVHEGEGPNAQVVAISQERLAKGGELSHPALPFRLSVRNYWRNSQLHMVGREGSTNTVPAATKGAGARVAVSSRPRETDPERRDVPSAVVEVLKTDGTSLGTWLVSEGLVASQNVEGMPGWTLQMRPVRYYKPYSLTLHDFTHDKYAGTRISKNFASQVTLVDEERGENREVSIYMNNPLRHRGDTIYQSGFAPDERGTILQVVHNPGFIAPYIACVIVGTGLSIQFLSHLVVFASRRTRESQS